jgi:predicted nuclease of predicted toxin-antitoxin system
VEFIADESCDFAIVRALRAEGHDVLAVAEVAPRLPDKDVIDRAAREERILLTEDKDFGQLVFASRIPSAGVVLFRFPAGSRAHMARQGVDLVRRRGIELAGRFVVVQPGRVRIGKSPIPPPS